MLKLTQIGKADKVGEMSDPMKYRVDGLPITHQCFVDQGERDDDGNPQWTIAWETKGRSVPVTLGPYATPELAKDAVEEYAIEKGIIEDASAADAIFI